MQIFTLTNLMMHITHGILPAVAIVISGSSLFGVTLNKKQILLLSLIAIIPFRIVGTYSLPPGLNVLVLIGSLTLFCYMVLRVNFVASLFITTLGEFLWSLLERPIFELAVFLFNINEQGFSQGENLLINYICMGVIGGILFLLAFICNRYELNLMALLKRSNLDINTEEQHRFTNNLLTMTLLLLIPVITLICINAAIRVFGKGEQIKDFIALLAKVDVLLIFILGATSIYGIVRIFQIMEQEWASKYAVKQLGHLEQLIFNIRKQKHDFNHHMQAVYGMLNANDYDNAKDYLKRNMDTASHHSALIKTDNPEVMALLYAKIGNAESRGIDIDINISGSLKDLSISNHELNSVIGNLLDNAIKAAESTDEKRVELQILRNADKLMVESSNSSTITEEELLKKMNRPKPSTKKHGLGISIIQDITEKYGGKLDVMFGINEITFCSSIPIKG